MNGSWPAAGTAFDAVLFDLDGTLIDTAPDMVAALIRLQAERGDPAIAYEIARSNVSNGAAGLIRLAFPDVGDPERTALHGRYLALYRQALCRESRVYPGLESLLDLFERHGRPWGIVTNKPRALTDELLAALGLDSRIGCSVSGDTLPQRKPHPAPMLLASRLLDVEPARIVYVGDAARDIEAGRAAGMATIAAAWGYITDNDDPLHWRADVIARDPARTHPSADKSS
ncbi:MAG: HAD-IA family hydrolase [Woeseiaceae bacterium]|nr:HAD-IA family hydrolase [Woeseiaceae bacterium]